MKAMLCTELGPPESLVLTDVPDPELTPDGVRIRVRAAGVNFPDTLIIKGEYQFKPPLPFSPGAEVAGEVLEVGANVTGFQPGDRVLAGMIFGGYAEQVVVHHGAVHKVPDTMDDVTAAALMLTYGTSAHALIQRGELKAGETLLVHGASGGVGLSAVEIGVAMGARVIGTGGDDEKLKTVLERGAESVVNYTDGFKDQVKELTGGKGADVIYDPVGGDVFDQSLRCIAWNGRLLVIGFAGGRIPQAPANLLLLKSASVVGVFYGQFTVVEPANAKANVAQLFAWFDEGKIRPHVSHTMPLAEAAGALNALLERKVVGKAVLTV